MCVVQKRFFTLSLKRQKKKREITCAEMTKIPVPIVKVDHAFKANTCHSTASMMIEPTTSKSLLLLIVEFVFLTILNHTNRVKKSLDTLHGDGMGEMVMSVFVH